MNLMVSPVWPHTNISFVDPGELLKVPDHLLACRGENSGWDLVFYSMLIRFPSGNA